MVGMNIEIPETLDKKLALYKMFKNKKNKQEALLEVAEEYFIKKPSLFQTLASKEIKNGEKRGKQK